MDISAFEKTLAACAGTFSTLGLEAQGAIAEAGDAAEVTYSGEKGSVRFSFSGGKLSAFDENDKRIVYALLGDEPTDKDIRFVSGEIVETLNDKMGQKLPPAKRGNTKVQTVSKAAVKAGSSYDAETLASKLCHLYPQLKPSFDANVIHYGEFLPQEFFVDYATPVIINTIKDGKPAAMKKLFTLLNEMFEDGTNDLQSLIAVTIMGELNNDKILLARCVDYMSDTMAPPVIEVNKYLASSKGKRARAKMANPPAYKPKKAKKPGIMERMMGGAQQGGIERQ